MIDHITCRHLTVAFARLHAFRCHGVIADQKECSRRDVIGEATSEKRCRLHIDSHCPCGAEILLELVVVLPDASVGRIDCAGPVIEAKVSDC